MNPCPEEDERRDRKGDETSENESSDEGRELSIGHDSGLALKRARCPTAAVKARA